MRPGADDARGPHRRPRLAARPDRPLRPADDGGGVPRYRPPSSQPMPTGRRSSAHETGERAAARRRLFFSWRRVSAILLRHLYVLRRSWPRLLELAYWPTVQMVLWGFVTLFFVQHSSWVAQAAGVLISAVLLWDILFRANLGVSVTFMEEMWARNLAQLFASPLRPYELVVALALMSLIRTVISVLPAMLLSLPLFGVSVFALGLPLAAFFANLLVFRLVDRAGRLGAGAAPRPGRREPGVGGHLRHRAAERRLLSDRRLAVLAAAGRLVAAVGLRVRRHARRPVRGPVPPRPAGRGRPAQPRLPGAGEPASSCASARSPASAGCWCSRASEPADEDQPAGGSAGISICSGWFTSIIGPFSFSIQPRTRITLPCSAKRSKPCLGEQRQGRLADADREVVAPVLAEVEVPPVLPAARTSPPGLRRAGSCR